MWRYSWLNVTHTKPYKRRYEGKTNGLLIAFIGYVNDLNKLRQFKVSLQKSHHRIFSSLGNSTCNSPEAVLAFLLYDSSERPIRLLCLLFLYRLCFSFIPTDKNLKEYTPASNSYIFTPTENWTHVYMNLFTWKSPTTAS